MITYAFVKKFVKDFYKKNNIKLELYDDPVWGGGTWATKNLIQLAPFEKDCYSSPEEALSLAFHEYCHIYCYRNNIYKLFHTPDERHTKREWKKILRVALKAEIYVDKKAKSFFKELFPKLKYWESYGTKEDKEYFKENWVYPLKLHHLKENKK